MLTELTSEQEAALKPHAEKWVKIGLNCDPADKKTAEEGFKLAYEAADLEWPGKVVWVSSPIVGALAFSELTGGQWCSYIGGSLWPYYTAYATFYNDHCGLDIPIEHYDKIARSSGWWWPSDQFVIACDRPEFIKLDEEGQLHSESGPAIQWRDGWSISYWHGTEIPGEWVTGKIDPTIGLTWDNVEQRRCAAEIIGWDNILDKLNPRIIDTDPDPQIGTLVEVDLPDNGPCKFLRVLEKRTGRRFSLYAAKDAKTALEAQAKSYGIPEDIFKHGFVRT